jgi:hypothetical protein
MSGGQIFRILAVAVSLALAFRWIILVGKLAWFHPDKFEDMISYYNQYNPFYYVYRQKPDWNMIWMWRVFTLIATLLILVVAIELLLGLLTLIL